MKTKITEARNAEAVTIPRAEYEQMQGQISAQEKQISVLEKQVELLTEALRLSRQKQFGASSERTSEDAVEQLSLLFNEVEVYADQAAKEDDSSVAVAAHKRHRKHEYRPIFHRGGAKTAGAAGESNCPESWWTNVCPLSGHSSTRDRDRES